MPTVGARGRLADMTAAIGVIAGVVQRKFGGDDGGVHA